MHAIDDEDRRFMDILRVSRTYEPDHLGVKFVVLAVSRGSSERIHFKNLRASESAPISLFP
jgi:hypothetical protein